jgi:beta-lactamase regulating signal transducer with metallopeptidase domain
MTTLFEIGLVNAALATLLAVGVWIVTRIWRQPVLVHALWVVVLVKLVTPPMIGIPWQIISEANNAPAQDKSDATVASSQVAIATTPAWTAEHASIAPDTSLRVITTDQLAFEQGETLPQDPSSFVDACITLAAAVWLAGTGIFLAVTVVRLTGFHRALAHASAAPRDLDELAEQVAKRFGIRGYRLRVTEGRLTPLVWPIGRPTIVFSRPLLAELSPDETQTLLAHEFAHLRRKDHWVRWLELAAVTIYWWLPVVWWARTMIRRTEERACDAWVAWAFPDTALRYATALFTAVEFVSNPRPAPPMVASRLNAGGNLKERIENIMSGNCDRRLSFVSKCVVLVVALLVLPLSLRGVRAADEPSAPEGATLSIEGGTLSVVGTTSEPTLGIVGTISTATPSSKVEQEIERQLQTPVHINYADVPLNEVMAVLGQSVGIDIHLDRAGLEQEGIATDEPVTISLKNKVSLRSALNLILKPLHLKYSIEDEVLKITNDQKPDATLAFANFPAAVNDAARSNPFAAATPETQNKAVASSPVSDAPLSASVWKKIVDGKKRSYERMLALGKKNVISSSELEQAKNDYEVSIARHEQALRALKYNQLLVELAEVEYQAAVESSKVSPGSVTDFEVRKLKIKVDLAKAKLSELGE